MNIYFDQNMFPTWESRRSMKPDNTYGRTYYINRDWRILQQSSQWLPPGWSKMADAGSTSGFKYNGRFFWGGKRGWGDGRTQFVYPDPDPQFENLPPPTTDPPRANDELNGAVVSGTFEEFLAIKQAAEATSSVAAAAAAAAAAPARAAGTASPAVLQPQKIHLPPGWSQAMDPRTRQIYYINHVTQTTQWDPPPVAAAPKPTHAHHNAGMSYEEALRAAKAASMAKKTSQPHEEIEAKRDLQAALGRMEGGSSKKKRASKKKHTTKKRKSKKKKKKKTKRRRTRRR